MKTGGYDFAGVEPRRQFPGEQNVAEFGAAVGPHHCPIVRACEIASIDAVAAVRLRGDRDDPRRCRSLQAVEQQIGQQERCEVIDREGQLETVR